MLKESRVSVRLLLLLTIVGSMLLSGVGMSAVAAQAGATSFTSPMTGSVINTTGSWTIDTTSVASQDGIESITLTGPYDFMQVWFMPAGLDLVAARDIILDSFATEFGTFVEIDRGAYGDVSYSLDMTSSEGVEFGVFSLFLGQRASGFVEYYVYFGPVIYFQQGFAAAQQSVTVNGNPVFGGVDGAGLQNLLSANAGAAGGAVQPPAGEVVPGNQPPAAPTQVPAAPTEPPSPPPSDPAATSSEGAAYFTTLQSELTYIQTTITDATTNFAGLEGDNSAAAIEAISRIAAEWSAYPDRAAGIVVPAGYEGVHASYQALAGQLGQLGTSWSGFVDSIQTGDVTAIQSTLQTFLDQFVGIQGQIDALNAQIAESQAGSVPAAQPTAAPVAAATEVAPAQDLGEGAAYISAVQAELTYLEGTLSDFATNFGLLEGETSEAAIAEINRVSDEWEAYPERAAGIVAPAGYEDIDASYRALAAQIEQLSSSWLAVLEALQTGDEQASTLAITEFFDTLVTTQGQIDDLSAQLASQDAGVGQTAQSTEASQNAQAEVTEESPTEEATDLTGQGQNDEGSTAASTDLPDPDEEDTQEAITNETETGRGGQGADVADFEELGLVEEGEYVSPQFDVEITWDDTWVFASNFEEPITSDEKAGVDTVTISWTGEGGSSIFITVAEPADEVTPEALADYWASDEYVLEAVGEDGEVLLNDTSRSGSGAVLIRGFLEDGTEVLVLREAMCADTQCDSLAISMMVGEPNSFADAYADARSGVEVDGERLIGVFSAREIEAGIDD